MNSPDRTACEQSRGGTSTASAASAWARSRWRRCWPAKSSRRAGAAATDRRPIRWPKPAGPFRAQGQARDLPVHGRRAQPARFVRLQAGAGEARRPADSGRDRPRSALCLHSPRRQAAGARGSSSPGTASAAPNCRRSCPAWPRWSTTWHRQVRCTPISSIMRRRSCS